MSTETHNDTPATGFAFSREGFVAVFEEQVKPLILQEWDAVSATELAETGGEPEKVLALVVEKTDHSKARVRKHLNEIAEVAGVDAQGVEARLLRLLHRLESSAGPLQERAEQTREAVRELRDQGRVVLDEARQVFPRAEEKVKDNLWTALLASLGVGLLLGLIVGLSRGR